MVVLYCPPDGIVGAADPALGLELDIRSEAELGTAHDAMITKLIFHVAK